MLGVKHFGMHGRLPSSRSYTAYLIDQIDLLVKIIRGSQAGNRQTCIFFL